MVRVMVGTYKYLKFRQFLSFELSLPAFYSFKWRLLEWLAEQLLIARLPVRIPPKARGIPVIPPIFDGCGHS